VSVNRLAFAQGHELEPYGATAVAITPGWLRSEMMLDNFGVSEANWRDAIDGKERERLAARREFALSESPRYVGRAVAALAADPHRARWNKKSVTSGSSPRSTDSLILMAHSPTSGGTWRTARAGSMHTSKLIGDG
jgi:NAD(P)-dependent dehydrogenase (short-subunit alcohol dehydrogenase family)